MFQPLALQLAQDADPRSEPILWQVVSDAELAPALANSLHDALRKMYVGERYYDRSGITSAARQRVEQATLPRIDPSSRWPSVVALSLLAWTSPEQAIERTQALVDDEKTDAMLRRDAFQMLLLCQTKTRANKTALAGLSSPDLYLRRLAVSHLAGGSEFSSVADGAIHVYGLGASDV